MPSVAFHPIPRNPVLLPQLTVPVALLVPQGINSAPASRTVFVERKETKQKQTPLNATQQCSALHYTSRTIRCLLCLGGSKAAPVLVPEPAEHEDADSTLPQADSASRVPIALARSSATIACFW